MKIKKILISLFLFLIYSLSCQSHNLDSGLLNITLKNDLSANIQWKTNNKQMRGMGIDAMPVFPANCKIISDRKITVNGWSVIYQWEIGCESTLINQPIHFTDLEHSVMVVFTGQDGKRVSRLISNISPVFLIPETGYQFHKVQEYVFSGIVHLFSGLDHVLFVIGILVLLYKKQRALIIAISCFTLGHSFSLVMASFGFFTFNVRIIEVIIALTLIVLALEILKMDKVASSLSVRNKPYLLTFTFGLIHGCGFARVIADSLTGESDLIIPIFSFNVGIEIGQIIIIISGLMVIQFFQVIGFQCKSTMTPKLIAYLMGLLSTYWFVERLLSY